MCPDYAPDCGNTNAPGASVGDECNTKCRGYLSAGQLKICNTNWPESTDWGWCPQSDPCQAAPNEPNTVEEDANEGNGQNAGAVPTTTLPEAIVSFAEGGTVFWTTLCVVV